MPFVTTFIVLAFGGVIDAGYLWYQHRKKAGAPMICPMDHDCSAVTESKWASTFGIRNELLGLLFYVAMLAGGLWAFFRPDLANILHLLLLLATGGGVLFSAFLIWIQIRKIHDYCFYCLISAGLTLLLFINAIKLYADTLS